MRTNKKLIASLAACAMMLLASVFCMTAFAGKADSDEVVPAADNTVVSGCDLKKEDLQMVKVDIANFKMLVPKGDILSVESSAEVFAKSEFDRNTLISENVFFYFNTNKDNYCQVYAGMTDLNIFERYYGDYSSLTKEQQDELLAQQVTAGDTTSKGSFEKINGRTYMMISKTDSDESTGNKYVVYGLYTVIGNHKYIIQIVGVNPNSDDLGVINEMLNSIKLGGISEPMSTLEVALVVCGVILLAAVAFAIFTLYRIDRFIKAGAELKSVFGFDLPDVQSVEDPDDDMDDDDEFEDEVSPSDTETDDLDSDEKIIDHESDSK